MLRLVVLTLAVACIQAEIRSCLPGGYCDIDVGSQQALDAVSFTEEQLNARSNSMFMNKVTKIVSARRQVVNGYNFKITFEWSKTGCFKNRQHELKDCVADDQVPVQDCTATVYKPISGRTMLSTFRCKAQPSKRSSLTRRAGWFLSPESNPMLYNMTATWALKHERVYLKDWRIVRGDANSQSGLKLRFTVEGDLDGQKTQCRIESWIRTQFADDSDNRYEVTRFKCTPVSMEKRAGRERKVDNPEIYRDTAIRALALSNGAFEDEFKIVEATTQVVAGQMIRLTLEGTQKGEKSQCKLAVWSRPWLGSENGFKVTDFSCSQMKTKETRAIRGGPRKVDNPEIYRDTAIRALALSNGRFEDEFKIVEATTQVVAGQKIRLTLEGTQKGEKSQCKLAVWSRPWMGAKEGFKVTEFSCTKKSDKMEKRAGQQKKVDNPEIYRDTAIRALALSNGAFEDEFKIVEATTQVVAGQMIRLTLEGTQKGETSQCKLAVWSRPWLKSEESFKVTQFACQKKSKSRRSLRLGGIRPTGGVSGELGEEARAMYRDTAFRALKMQNSALKNVELVGVKTQVVAGQKLYLRVKGDEGGVKKVCDITVWIRTWMSGDEGFKVMSNDCKKASDSESKRELIQMKPDRIIGNCAGCVSDEVKDPNSNSKYMSLYISAFGLAKTNMDIGNINIISVRTQVVAGTKYIMKVKTSEAGEPRMCDVELVERPWMSPSVKVLKFDCKPIN